MSVLKPAPVAALPQLVKAVPVKNSPDTLVSRTHGRIYEILKNGKPLHEKSEAVKQILDEAFEEAEETEELLDLKEALIVELTRVNDELLQRVNTISGDHNILKSKYGALEGRTEKLQQDVNALSGKNKSLKTDYAELKQKGADLKLECEALEGKYQTLEEQYDSLSQENEELKGRAKALKKESAKLADDYAQLEGENQGFKDDSELLNQKLAALETQYQELKDETDAWAARYEELNEEYSGLKETVDAALKQGVKGHKPPEENEFAKFDCGTVANFFGRVVWNSLPYPLDRFIERGINYYDQQGQDAKK